MIGLVQQNWTTLILMLVFNIIWGKTLFKLDKKEKNKFPCGVQKLQYIFSTFH